MNVLPHLAARLFGAPLMIHQAKLEVILSVLGARIGLPETASPTATPPAEPPRVVPAQIAVLPIVGSLVRRTVGLEANSGLMSYAAIGQQLEAAVANPVVVGILLDIDTPGGEVGGVFDLADRIHAASQKKPVFAVAAEQALSAGYALASGASRLFVSRTSSVGSIGVLALHVDQSAKDARDGLRYTTVFAGRRKNDLNPHEPLSPEALTFLHSEVDRVYGLFVDTVARHRKLSLEAVRATEAGLFFGEQAIHAGLADALGTFDDALEALITRVSPQPVFIIQARPSLPQPTMESFMPDLVTSAPSSEPAVPTAPVSTPAPEPSPATPQPTPVSSPPPTLVSAAMITATPVPTSVSPPVTVSSTAVADGLSVEAMLEITQLCTLAGCAERVMGFLEARTPPAQVRAQLLTLQAERSPEIISRLSPDAPVASASLQQNPVVLAVKKLIGKE